MKKGQTQRFQLDKMSKGETEELAAQLAPLEEQNKSAADRQSLIHPPPIHQGANQEIGAIVVDNSRANLSAVVDVRRGKTFMGMEPVVLVILCGMLAFIAFIAWQISQMPVE